MKTANDWALANGFDQWPNYETARLVELLQNSDEFDGWLRMAEMMSRETVCLPAGLSDFGRRHFVTQRLAKELAHYFVAWLPRTLSPPERDSVTAGLRHVHWHEIAAYLLRPKNGDQWLAIIAGLLDREPPIWRQWTERAFRAIRKSLQTRHT